MSGITSNFVNRYIELKQSGKELTNTEVKGLVKDVVDASGNDVKALDKLKEEVFKDGRIDKDESKLLFMLGFASDSSNTKTFDEIKSHLMKPNDDRVSELLSKGFGEGKVAVDKYRNNDGFKSTTRDVANTLTLGLVDNADQAVKYNNKGVANSMDKTLDSLDSSAQKTNCVRVALEAMDIPLVDSAFGTVGQVVSERALNEATGVKDKNKNGWDAIAPAQYNNAGKNDDLQKLLKGSAGKALVILGAHAYKFEGFNNDGNILARDPSDGNKLKVIQKDNPAVTVYVKKVDGKGGDEAATQRINIDANGLTFEQLKKSKITNSSDTMDKTGESLNIRKLLVLVGDKTQKPEDRQALLTAIKTNNISSIQKTLAKQGIVINNQELKAFMSVMNSTVNDNGKPTSMIKELEKLTSTATNQDRANYSSGVVYSDVSLKDYFTKTNPQAIFNTFQDMIHGKDGC